MFLFNDAAIHTAPTVFVPVIFGVDGAVGKIGVEHGVTGSHASYSWKVDGVEQATTATYTPDAADDELELTCTVPGTDPAGVTITYVAPTYDGGLFTPDTQTDGDTFGPLDVAPFFTGDDITWSIEAGPGWLEFDIAPDDSDLIGTISGIAVTPTTIRATNSGGYAEVDFDISVVAAAAVPSAFAEGQWTVDAVNVNIVSLPADNGSPITDIELSINGGAYASAGVTSGSFAHAAAVGDDLEIIAVNSVGDGGEPDDPKAVPAPEPNWVTLDGATSLRFATVLGSDDAGTGSLLAIPLRNITVTGVQQCIHDLTGRGEVTISSSGLVRVRARSTADVMLCDWNSAGGIDVDATGDHMLVVKYALTGGSPAITVYWDGSVVTGAYTVGPIAGTIEWTRNGNGLGSTFDAAGEFLNAQVGGFYLKTGGASAVAASNFWSGGPVMYTGDSPTILFTGDYMDWQAGVNEGSATSTWTAAGTFTGDTEVDPPINLLPEALTGFGSGTSGGRGGRVVRVTSLSNSAGTANSIRWALTQYTGQPLYIVLCAEGNIPFGTAVYTIPNSRPNITIDGRYAPGAGCWFTGDRVEVEANNVMLDGISHFGNAATTGGSHDCVRWGLNSTSTNTTIVNTGYCRRSEFHHGRDETFSFTPRSNGQASGPKAMNVTVERNIFANPIYDGEGKFCFAGDGTERVTWGNNLLYNGAQRSPFIRGNTSEIEWINNAGFNSNQNTAKVVTTGEASIRGNLFRLGPMWTDNRAPYELESGHSAYVADTVFDSTIGETNSHGATRGTASLGSPSFTASGYTIRAGSTVAAFMVAGNVGALGYGGVTRARSAAMLSGFAAGNASAYPTYPGTVPTALGHSFPASNINGVPTAYLTTFPDDTSLETMIEGGPWDGYMVAERVGAWLVSEFNV
jgi:hypothetical protein